MKLNNNCSVFLYWIASFLAMTTTRIVIARPQRLHQTGENHNEKNVILNEVKNLYCGLTFCYDAILHFVQNDKGGRGRMTEGRFVIARPRRKNAFFKHAEMDEFTKLVIGRNEAIQHPVFI